MAGRFKSSYVVIEAAKMSPSRIKIQFLSVCSILKREVIVESRISEQEYFQQCQDSLDSCAPAVTEAGAGAAVVVCWAGWGRLQ